MISVIWESNIRALKRHVCDGLQLSSLDPCRFGSCEIFLASSDHPPNALIDNLDFRSAESCFYFSGQFVFCIGKTSITKRHPLTKWSNLNLSTLALALPENVYMANAQSGMLCKVHL